MQRISKILLWGLATTAILGTGSAQATNFISGNSETINSSFPQRLRVKKTLFKTQMTFFEETSHIKPSFETTDFTEAEVIKLTLTSDQPRLNTQISFPKIVIKDSAKAREIPEPPISLLDLVGITILGVGCKKQCVQGKK